MNEASRGFAAKAPAHDAAEGKVAMLHQLLKLTNRLMAPFSTHLAHRYKISLNEFRLLMTIGALGRTASHELAELTGVNVMSVSRAVATLERHGRIEVALDPRNRRRKWLSLTEEGQRLFEIMRPQSEKVAEYLFSEFEPAEVAQLETILTRLIGTLEASDEAGRSLFLERTAAGMTEEERRAIEAGCERLIKLYFNLGDAQDWPAVAALYTEDARFARPSQPGVFVEGREAILAGFLARPARTQRHVVANVVVDVEDEDHARAFSVIVLYMGDATDGGLPAMGPKSPLVGTFTDKLVRTKDGWRFAERVGGLDFRP